MFSYWTTLMGALIREAKQQGRYQEGIVDIVAETIKVEEELVLSNKMGDGAETGYVRCVSGRQNRAT